MTTTQGLIHFTAECLVCGASVAARNAQAWAHNHARHTGHNVELSLGWLVKGDPVSPPPAKPKPINLADALKRSLR